MDQGQILQLVALIFTGIGALAVVAWALILYTNKAADKLWKSLNDMDEKRSKNAALLHDKIDNTAGSLDKKYNAVRDEVSGVKDNYVRRDDLQSHLNRIENGQNSIALSIEHLRQRVEEIAVDTAKKRAIE